MRRFLTVAFSFLASMAYGQSNMQEWGESGDWIILVDPSNGNGCLMQKDFEDGLRVQLGFEPDRNGGFFAAFKKEWTQIQDGTSGTIKFITDEAKFAGDVDMVQTGDWRGGRAFFNNPNLVVELSQRRSLTVIGPSGGTFDIDLGGTARAIALVKDCQTEQ